MNNSWISDISGAFFKEKKKLLQDDYDLKSISINDDLLKWDISAEIANEKMNTEKRIYDIVFWWDVINYNERSKENWMINHWVNISSEQMIKILGIDLSNIKWQKILDFWWGFSVLPFMTEWQDAEIIIIDPTFSNWIKWVELEKNIKNIYKRMEHLSRGLITKYEEYNEYTSIRDHLDRLDNDIDYYNRNKHLRNHLYNHLWEVELDLRNKDKRIEWFYNSLEVSKQINQELGKWENISDYYTYENNQSLIWWQYKWDWETKLKIITSTQDYGIEHNSIDKIIVSHVITKLTVNTEEIINQLYNFLKPWGKLYITENWIKEEVLKLDGHVYNDFDLEIFDPETHHEKTVLILTKK